LLRKKSKKTLNILLIPDNEATPKNFRIRYASLNALLIGLGIFVIAIFYGVVTYSQVYQAATEKNALELENVELRGQLKKVNQLQNELELLRSYNDKVRNSLQGYVKFTDGGNEQVIPESELIKPESRHSSLSTAVPLKTPLEGFPSQEYRWPFHYGIDIVATEGTPIHAAADGVVIFSGWTYDKGYTVALYHTDGYLTFYRHNQRNLVSEYQRVKQGEVIALLGNSGAGSSGPHLHYEIWKNGKPVNPRLYIKDLDTNVGE